jgi:Lon protease-like protein
VLFPGAVLPLHVFEERYRLLVHDLLDQPEPHSFGVVAIELGHEVGARAARQLAQVGCTAILHQVTPHTDGRYDLITVGDQRFRITDVDDSQPYLRATVTPLPDQPGTGPDGPAQQVDRLFHHYRRRLIDAGAEAGQAVDLPADPVRLSYLIAGALVLDRTEKQRLLEAADATVRLVMEADLLLREIRLLNVLPSVPAYHLIEGGAHPN